MSDEPPQGMERRMVHRLLAIWRRAQGEADGPPSLDALFAMQPDDEIVNAMFILDVPADGGAPTYVRIGANFRAEGAASLVGLAVTETPPATLLAKAVEFHDKVRGRGVPVTLGGDYVNTQGQNILYRSIIVPISNGGSRVDRLMGAANCKIKGSNG